MYHADLEDPNKIHLIEFQKMDADAIKKLVGTFESKFVYFENIDLNDLDKTVDASKSMHRLNSSGTTSKPAPYQVPHVGKTTQNQSHAKTVNNNAKQAPQNQVSLQSKSTTQYQKTASTSSLYNKSTIYDFS